MVIQSLQDENLALRNTLQQMSVLALPSELASGPSSQVNMLSCRVLHKLNKSDLITTAVLSISFLCSLQMKGIQTG